MYVVELGVFCDCIVVGGVLLGGDLVVVVILMNCDCFVYLIVF